MERTLVNHKKRKVVVTDDEDEDYGVKVKERRFKILLPNGMSVELKLRNTEHEMLFRDFIRLVRDKYLKARKNSESLKKKREINWSLGALFLQDASDTQIINVVNLAKYEPYKCHILRLYDGSSDVAKTFENMWDLTPNTELLLELPEEYTFEAALADLIDNSLQAVWSNEENNGKLIRVNVNKDKILIFDNGPGMDDSEENSLVKWGKLGASLNRDSKSLAIGGKPPYLKPYFGMFGYGGPVASMHLGKYTRVSSKTKDVKKVYVLLLDRKTLLSTSNSGATWKTNGGVRDPSKVEIRDSHGSFTKVEIFQPKVQNVDIEKLRCHLKDIYFPYIQSDDLSDKGKTITPIEFQVNGADLTEIQGGEVAITNLHSCNGPDFVLQLHLSQEQEDCSGSREIQVANARLRFVYFPFTKGKENIERVLEKLKAEGWAVRENFNNFSRVSVRRLGRLLPDARWTLLPLMDFRNKKGNKASILKRCCMRVKCFIETDAGFKPTQYKNDLAQHSPFTIALKNLGNKTSDKENGVAVEICMGGKSTKLLTTSQLEREYQEWIFQMHAQYDEEADSGEDQPVIIVNPANKKALGISSNVVRVHQALKRKEKFWQHGQKIKVLKGACAGCHNSNVYATIEYFLLEGFQGEAGGEARIICRPMDIPEKYGSSLSVNDKDASLDMGRSLSLPISVIDLDKVVSVENIEWDSRLRKRQQKPPAVGSKHCQGPNVEKVAVVERIEWDGALGKRPPESPSIYTPSPNHPKGSKDCEMDSISESFEEMVTMNPSDCGPQYKLITDDRSPQLDVRVGSRFPILEIGCYDIDHNRAPFHTIPEVTVKLQAGKDFYIEVHGTRIGLSTDKMTLKIMDVMVTRNDFHRIEANYRNYRTTLIIVSKNVPLSLSIPCRVYPGYLKLVELKPKITEDQLLPGFIFKELILEMFDEYGNHVPEGLEVTISVAGLAILNHGSTMYKVDGKGEVNLGGLLKITAGFGETASLSVIFESKTIFKQVFSTVRRILRIASGVPEFCAAGGQLENIEFEIVNVDGVVDTKIHHSDQDLQFHMLIVKSNFPNAEESIRYTFKHGRCTIPSIRVPVTDGTFCFEACHFQYTELCQTVKIQVKMMNSQCDDQPVPLQEEFNHGKNLMLSIINDDDKRIDKICRLGEKINDIEKYLHAYEVLKAEAEQEMLRLLDKAQEYKLGNADSLITKDEMTTKIKDLENSAASVACLLSTEDIIGVVALLGSVQSPELSRMLAEYIGEDKMLAVICRSFNTASSLERYTQTGEMDFVSTLHAEAAVIGKPISKRFLVMCFEDIRPYTGFRENDVQRKLALPCPRFPNERTPEGFLGYAVNMVNLDSNHLHTRTASGYGLRETVLFSLFKKLHVYKTRESMVAALDCIQDDGAVSLDGGIIRENGMLSFINGNPSIYFPCVNEKDLSPEAKEIITQIRGQKTYLKTIEEAIRKKTERRKKKLKKFGKRRERYFELMDKIEPISQALADN